MHSLSLVDRVRANGSAAWQRLVNLYGPLGRAQKINGPLNACELAFFISRRAPADGFQAG